MGVIAILLYVIGGVLLLAAGLVSWFTVYVYNLHSKFSHIPSPKRPNTLAGFYLGHIPVIAESRKRRNNDEYDWNLYFEWYNEIGCPSVFVVFMMTTPFVIPCDPELIKSVVMEIKNGKSARFKRSGSWLFGERFTGDGLASIPDYNTWKPRRRVYDPSFNKGYLKSLLPSFNECTNKLLDALRPLADGKTVVPMKQHLAEVTLDVISKVAFGSDFSKIWDDKALGLKRAKGTGKLTFLISHCFKGIQRAISKPFFEILHPLEAASYRETVRALRIIGKDCILKRINAIEAGEEVPRDILSSILQVSSTKETVDIEDLVDDFVTFYVAGQETTGNLLSFAIAVLHQHPHILERLQVEVNEVLQEKSEITYGDLEKLQYTEQVLLEVLRMYPPAPAILKESYKEGIQLGDYFIPGGSLIFLITVMMSGMPQYFDDPETFNPSRFDPENKQPSSFVYFPFGLGHRSCIGKHFALMEAKLILARLIQTFKFALPIDYKLVTAQRVTLQPKDDVPCTVTLQT